MLQHYHFFFFFWKRIVSFINREKMEYNLVRHNSHIYSRIREGKIHIEWGHDTFPNLNKLHNWEGIIFNNDTGDVHFLGKDDPIFQSNGFSCISKVASWEFCLLLLWHGHWSLGWLLRCMRVFHLQLLHHQH